MSSKKVKVTGRQIAAARELLDITQAQLAEAAGISRATLAFLERNKHAPRKLTMEKLKAALLERGISFDNEGRLTILQERRPAGE